MSIIRRKTLGSVLAVALLCGAGACQQSGTLQLSFTQVPEPSRNLQLLLRPDGYAAATVTTSKQSIALRLPENASGNLSILAGSFPEKSTCPLSLRWESINLASSTQVDIPLPKNCDLNCACWLAPQPRGDYIGSISGNGPEDLWLTTDDGSLLHLVKGTVSRVSLGPVALRGLHVNPDGSGYAVGWQSTILHLSGGRFTPAPVRLSSKQYRLEAVWVQKDGKLGYAVGSEIILRWDGQVWTEHQKLPEVEFFGVAADPVGGIFASGHHYKDPMTLVGHLRKIDSMGSVVLYDDGFPLGGVWASRVMGAPANVWAAGYEIVHYNGKGIVKYPQSDRYLAVAGGGVHDVWFASYNGKLLHYEASGFSKPIDVAAPLLSAWVGSTGPLFGSVGGGLYGIENGKAIDQASKLGLNRAPTRRALYDAYIASQNDVWFVGDQGAILHFDGLGIRPMAEESNLGLRGIAGSGEEIWIVGTEGTMVRRRKAGPWEKQPVQVNAHLFAVAMPAPDLGWAVGQMGTVLLYDGQRWTQKQSNTSVNLNDVFALSRSSAYIAGDAGVVLRISGTSLSTLPTLPGGANLQGIWASSEYDVWAVGASNAVWRWNGSKWQVQTDIRDWGRGIWGRGPNDVWVSGWNGMLSHFDGLRWTEEGGGSGSVFERVRGTATYGPFAVGDGGSVLIVRPPFTL